MTHYHINIFYSDEDDGYIADIPDLEACSAFGATAEQALAEVKRATGAWLAAARDGRLARCGARRALGSLRRATPGNPFLLLASAPAIYQAGR